MDKNQANHTDQCNPNNPETGPGREAGYGGTATKSDKDNHANQMNPNYDANPTNQCNPNNPETGPGREAGYGETATKADNPNYYGGNTKK